MNAAHVYVKFTGWLGNVLTISCVLLTYALVMIGSTNTSKMNNNFNHIMLLLFRCTLAAKTAVPNLPHRAAGMAVLFYSILNKELVDSA